MIKRLFFLVGCTAAFAATGCHNPWGSAYRYSQRPTNPVDALNEVLSWQFQRYSLDVHELGLSRFDLLAIDYSRDGTEAGALSSGDVAWLKNSPGGQKRVFAILPVGVAESDRYYWQPGWTTGSPLFVGEPLSGTSGRFGVQYWDPAWQSIVFGQPDSFLDKILARGFDGVLLDGVAEYQGAQAQRTTAKEDMIALLKAVSSYAKGRQPGFAVVPLDAADLASYPDVIAACDGVAQESVWFDPTDAPVPAATTASLVRQLDTWKAQNRIVFTVDYADQTVHIDAAYESSEAHGYIPLVTNAALNTVRINPGHEPQ